MPSDAYSFHPLVELFPKMNPEEFRQLQKSILEEGLLEPIEVYDEMIIDGRHRYNACHAIGVTPQFVEWVPEDGQSLVMHIAARNLHRRHLTTKDRAIIAERMVSIRQQEMEAQRKLIGEGKNIRALLPRSARNDRATQDKRVVANIADGMKVSERHVKSVKRIKAKAPDVYEQLVNTDLSIPRAEQIVKAREAPVVQSAPAVQAAPTKPTVSREEAESVKDYAAYVRECRAAICMVTGIDTEKFRRGYDAKDSSTLMLAIVDAESKMNELRFIVASAEAAKKAAN